MYLLTSIFGTEPKCFSALMSAVFLAILWVGHGLLDAVVRAGAGRPGPSGTLIKVPAVVLIRVAVETPQSA